MNAFFEVYIFFSLTNLEDTTALKCSNKCCPAELQGMNRLCNRVFLKGFNVLVHIIKTAHVLHLPVFCCFEQQKLKHIFHYFFYFSVKCS